MKRVRELTIDCEIEMECLNEFQPPKLKRTKTMKPFQINDFVKLNDEEKILKRTKTVQQPEFEFLLSVNELTK